MHTITRATLQDAPAMHAVQRRAFAEEARRSAPLQVPPMLETQEAIEAHIQGQTALVAREDGAIVGAVRGLVTGSECYIRALVVDPACQGRGLGPALLQALEHALPEVTRFALRTNMVMEGNVPFYERHGYRVTGYVRESKRVVLAEMAKEAAAYLGGSLPR